ncbi:BRCA1-associated protein-like protein [Euroglyphus maynei]|uniref:BRCA1-associated protein-like protein n=1 Tax=Euroglyphus maynei TaxID=6958 RepID=A0A1Y3BCQ3_EURMA|nr:BRCA1-associated protein-like protein [Euroglyphus maynei]
MSNSQPPTSNESSNDMNKFDLRQPHDITIEKYQLPFCIGNHNVETIQGILYLFKENKLTPLGEESERSDIICMLSVNANKSIHDILQFSAPFSQDIQHIQIIRDSTPNQYMVLLKFHSQRSADEFYNTFNGSTYNSIEPEVCHLAFVAMIEVLDDSKTSSQLPITGFTELPTCPVCLERMDESVQGILTILCNHSFHGKCLDQCVDSSCPVCRYCPTPEAMPDSRCSECGSQSTAQDSLWICLICGHIGCGRYLKGHASKHHKDTGHTYAMQLGHNNRVWDYAGDNYVHRLLQNKDGEPVELKANQSGQNNQLMQDEKIDSVQLEYTYLLTNQLENQRHYYEEKVNHLEKDNEKQMQELIDKNDHLMNENKNLTNCIDELKRSKQQLEKKLNQLTQKLQKTTTDLQEEKELNKCLRKNQEEYTKRLNETEKKFLDFKKEKDGEIDELKDQMRDLMFFLEAKEKINNLSDETLKDELETGTICIQQQQQQQSTSKTKSGLNKKVNKK